MEAISSGCYVIDADYNVVSVNHTAHELYPSLEVGAKCYRCLMGEESPCKLCPVNNGIKGPRTYTDPIRGIVESVDAVEVPLEGHGLCHSLVFSTVGKEELFAQTLPTTSDELRNLALIGALTVDYRHVLTVDTSTRRGTFYRKFGRSTVGDSGNAAEFDYEELLDQWIPACVHKDDRARVRKDARLDSIERVLAHNEAVVIHYRVVADGELHYDYAKFVRIGAEGSVRGIAIGVGSEDEGVRIAQQKAQLERNLSFVETDLLTGLYTKEAFLIHGEQLRRDNPDRDFDFCFLKIDNITQLNRHYGRLAIDELLVQTARLLETYKNDFTCLMYLGSGVFGCFRETMESQARKAGCMAFTRDLEERTGIRGASLKWSVYVAPRHGMDVEEIFEKTQYALSTIRARDDVDYVEFDQAIIDRMEWERLVENSFAGALAAGEIQIWFQPKFWTSSRKVSGAEALVRWVHPDGTMLMPGQFIPILERSGKIAQLDEFAFRKSCELVGKLRARGAELPISVNLSRADIVDEGLMARLGEYARVYDVPVSLVPIEITESAAVDEAEVKQLADLLAASGFVLHMDDFGSGFSSLASLGTFPFDCVKLDKSLVDLIGNRASERLLAHVIAYARETGKTVVAEGVETPAQLAFLNESGCDMVQGFLFSKVLEEGEFLRLVDAKG